MRAVDTNIVVRFLTDDDAKQSDRVRSIIALGDLFVATTVLLETEWVLRGIYSLPPHEIVRLLTIFAGLPGVQVEDPLLLKTALGWAAVGMDLADAIHLAGSGDCTAFVSFDRALAKAAAKHGALRVVEP